MELPQRKGEDRFLSPGRYREMEQCLVRHGKLDEVRSLVVSAFDRRTRMLPFIFVDWHTVPCGPRSIAGALVAAGMPRTRLVYQLWNPKVLPSRAQIDGGSIDMLLVSSMQVHSAASFRLVEDAWNMGDRRPLILAGGPKACYEPFDYFGLGPDGAVGADVVVTGEEAVLLELLNVLAEFGAGPGQMRTAFDRARKNGALEKIPGLVFPADGRCDGNHLINTGVQRMVQDLDELPMLLPGFKTLEPPHRGKVLAPRPMAPEKIGRKATVTAILITRGCKFHCHYCPIPSYNQRAFRRKSPARMVAEFSEGVRYLNSKYFFGADDNFFNDRDYARKLLETMAATRIDGVRLGRKIRFGTESTVFDAYKNRDLLPLASHHGCGLNGIWLGIEDLSATLVDKGQGPEIVKNLFAEMIKNDISPMVMLMHHDRQPLRSPGELTGLIDQIKFLHRAGAMSVQCTVANPAVGSRWMSEVYEKSLLYRRVGGQPIRDRDFDGNHVLAADVPQPWRMQLNLLRGYAAFYNPINLLRTLCKPKQYLRDKYIFYQIFGMAGLARTAWALKGYLWRLWRGPIEKASAWPEKFRRPGSPYTGLIQTPTPSAQTTRIGPEPVLPPAAANEGQKRPLALERE